MELGAFSISLSVQDLEASKVFYTKLGFVVVGGEESQNWLIVRHRTTTIGLFQGMFPKNMLTFNPGWDAQAQAVDDFTDVRMIEQHLKDQGIEPTMGVATDTGPGSLVIEDPDGNPILIDQHVG